MTKMDENNSMFENILFKMDKSTITTIIFSHSYTHKYNYQR